MPKPLPPPLRLTLRILRTARGWSQQTLAAAAGVGRDAIWRYENGRKPLDIHRLEQLVARMRYIAEDVSLTLLYLGALLPVTPDVDSLPGSASAEDHKRARRLATRMGLVEVHRVRSIFPALSGRTTAGACVEGAVLSRLILRFLRVVRGWTQEELAISADVHLRRISLYEEGNLHLRPIVAEQLVAAMGYVPSHVTLTALFLRALLPIAQDEDQRHARAHAIRMGVAAARSMAHLALDLARSHQIEEARRKASRQWQVLRRLPPPQQLVRVKHTGEMHHWALVELLCDESVKAAVQNPDESLRLAMVALRAAEVSPGGHRWLLGYVWAFLGNAHRLRFARSLAEAAFATARRLWEEDRPPGPQCPLGQWRLFDLEASLRRDCRQFPTAFELLNRALASAPPRAKARILVNKALTLEQAGDLRAALVVLTEATPLVEESADIDLQWALEFNRTTLLVHLGQFEGADTRLALLRTLATQRQARVPLTRILWLGARIAVGRGHRVDARVGLDQARREFAAMGFAVNHALVSLEMAVLDLEDGRFEAAASVALEMTGILRELRADRETLMGVRLFCEAARAHAATAEMARHLMENWNQLGGRGDDAVQGLKP